MPVFDFTAPNGKTYTVEGPEGATKEQAFAILQSQITQPDATETAVDVAKSTGIGAAKSVIGLADIPELGARGIDAATNYVSQKLGLGEAPRPVASPNAPRLPGSAEIQAKIEEHTGPFYKPKTYAGEWGETIGGYLPGMVGGPGGLMSRFVTQVALPAVASEGAGALTAGTKYEAPSRVAAALLAGPAATRSMAGRVAPSANELKAAYRDVVNDPVLRATPINTRGAPETRTILAGPGYHIADDLRGPSLSDKVVRALDEAGFDPLNSSKAFGRVAKLDSADTPGDVIAVRKKLSKDSAGVPSPETEAARFARGKVDEVISELSPEFRAANANYAAAKRSDLITGKVEQAENRAGAANSGANVANTIRQRMVDILNSPKLSKGFSAGELERIKEISRGTKGTNAVRYIGNLLGGGGGMGQFLVGGSLGAGGYAVGGEGGASAGLAIAGLGRGLKSVENALVRRQVSGLDAKVRANSPLGGGKPKLAPVEKDAIIRALLRGSAANASAESGR